MKKINKPPEIGDKFYKLTILGYDTSKLLRGNGKPRRQSEKYYLAKCECGNIVSVIAYNLHNGCSKQCKECRIKQIAKSKKKTNPIECHGDVILLSMFYSKSKVIIDKEDYSKVKDYCWHIHHGYVESTRAGVGSPIYLHRLILGTPENKITDHINGDTLDNRKSNLRICKDFQNAKNKKLRCDNVSGVRGVYLPKGTTKWKASIGVDYKTIHLGTFDSLGKAKEARIMAENKYYKEFAPSTSRGELIE